MDFEDIFRRKGFKYKYVYLLGSLENPKIVDGWEKDIIPDNELEERKRKLMQRYKLPVIAVEHVKL